MKRLIPILSVALAPALASGQVREIPPNLNPTRGFEFRVGGIYLSGERAQPNTVGDRKGNLKGFDGLLRGGGGGIAVRYLEGAFAGQPDSIISADVNLLLLSRKFSLVAGIARRGLVNGLEMQRFDFGRLGFSSSTWIGGTGLKTQVGGAYYIPIGGDKQSAATTSTTVMESGFEGEASIIWSPPRFPIFIQIGYRGEVFNMKTGSTTHSEIVRGLRLGGGLQFGGK